MFGLSASHTSILYSPVSLALPPPMVVSTAFAVPRWKVAGRDLATQDAPQLRELVVALAHCQGALDLRLARLACHVQTMDLRPLGYGSFTAFIQQELDWQPSRFRDLARLLRSDLNALKHAVVVGAVSVSAATRLATDHSRQQGWIARAAQDRLGVRPGHSATAAPAVPSQQLVGEDAVTVRLARTRMRLLLGYRAADRVCDRNILTAWSARLTAQTLLDGARPDPCTPDLRLPSWPDAASGSVSDPAAALLGPWRPPQGLQHGLSLIHRVQHLRRQRRLVLAYLLAHVVDCWDLLDWDHDRFADFVRARLDLSLRQAQRLCKLGRTLSQHASLAQAAAHGLPLTQAEAIGRLAQTDAQARRWLMLSSHMPQRELQDLSRDTPPRAVPALAKATQAAVDRAPELVAKAMARNAGATSVGGRALGTTDPAQIRVAHHPEDPDQQARRRTDAVWASPQLLQASRWLLKTVQLPRQRSYGRVKDQQHYICQNPECRRRSLRNQAHHDRPRALGGSDDDDNLRCLCASCHLRLVHGGFMAIHRVDGAHVYLYPGRAVVVS